MDFYQKKDTPNKPKSRKWLGCLVGCLIVFGFFLLFCICIAWLLFRAHPAISEDKFFSPEVTGFARFQIDAMQQGPAKELLQNLIQDTPPPSQDEKIQEIDTEGLWAAFDLILHKRHYIYLYNGKDENLDFLLVIDIKRFHWLLNSFFKGSETGDVEELPIPKEAKGHLYRLKSDKGEKFIGITSSAFFISNSQDRIQNALILVRSKDMPEELNPSVKTLLPPDNPDDMLSGFLLWREEFTGVVYTWALENNKELENLIDALYQALSEQSFDGIQVRCGLSSSDVLKMNIHIRCQDESQASLMAEYLEKALNHEDIPESIEKSCAPKGNMVQIEILIPGVETWLKDKFKE